MEPIKQLIIKSEPNIASTLIILFLPEAAFLVGTVGFVSSCLNKRCLFKSCWFILFPSFLKIVLKKIYNHRYIVPRKSGLVKQ